MASFPRSSGPNAQGPRVVFANISLVSNRHSNCYHYHSWSAQDERTVSNKINPVVLCFTPIFLNLVQLKYGGAGASPYRTHPLTMGFSIACLLVSCLAYLLKNAYLPDSSLPGVCGQALERTTLLLGSLSLASLVTLILPGSWTAYSYVGYIFLSVGAGALVCSMLLKCKISTSSETGTARGNLLLSGAASVDQESVLPV
ncbi:hypothetical protein ACJRO7_011308 [Eucalyptus globulus]|uniref:Uncharacterized protein n=1 Tax=Eucalyptus globulus TaxID=34317 RepID=A0ABD3LER6_EUCGL